MHPLKEWKVGDYATHGDRTGTIEKIIQTGPKGTVKLRYPDESKENVRSSDLVEAQGHCCAGNGICFKANVY